MRYHAVMMRSSLDEHTLPNGLRVVCEVMPNVRSAAAAFLVRTGSRHEAVHEHGVSHFLEHMCFKGTAERDAAAINVRFDELGAMYNAFTGKEHTVYYGWVPGPRVTALIELLSDMMRPALPAGEFDTERKVILEEIAMSGDSFDHHVWDVLHKRCFGEHPLSHEILGERETIAGLPLEVMQTYHARRYSPDNLVLIAAGAIDPAEVFASAGRWCGGWERCAPATRNGTVAFPSPPAEMVTHVLPQFKQQSLVWVHPSASAESADADTIETLVSIFGGSNSRAFWEVVQKGVCSQAGAAWISYEDGGLLAFYADGEPDRSESMHAALTREMQKLQERGVENEEVERVRRRRRTHFALEAENPRTRVMQMIDDIESYGVVRPAELRLAAADAVTPASIRDYLRRYPVADGAALFLSVGARDWSPSA